MDVDVFVFLETWQSGCPPEAGPPLVEMRRSREANEVIGVPTK